MVILYYLYKLCLKLQHQVIPEKGEALIGRIGTITIPNDISGGSSVILVEINGMLQELSAYAEEEHKTYKNGDKVRISKFEEEFKFSLQDLTNWWNKKVLDLSI